MKGYIFLTISIITEVIGTTMLKLSEGFTVLLPSILVAVCFTIAFTSITFSLKTIPLSIGYSIWSGAGTAGTAIVGVVFFDEVLSAVNLLGLFIIISGVFVMNMPLQRTEKMMKNRS